MQVSYKSHVEESVVAMEVLVSVLRSHQASPQETLELNSGGELSMLAGPVLASNDCLVFHCINWQP